MSEIAYAEVEVSELPAFIRKYGKRCRFHVKCGVSLRSTKEDADGYFRHFPIAGYVTVTRREVMRHVMDWQSFAERKGQPIYVKVGHCERSFFLCE